MWTILSGLYPAVSAGERRFGQRFPYPCLVQLTPVDDESAVPAGPPLVVAGKNISETGLGFYHPQPLPYRLMVAALERGDCGRLRILLDVHRCRFTRQGWYESAGRFLRILPVGVPASAGA